MTSPKNPRDPSPKPPPIRPSALLNAVFRDGGPYPPARFPIRALAFGLDFVLLTLLASLIIWKFALPQAHPGASKEFHLYSAEIVEWMGAPPETRSATFPKPTHSWEAAVAYGWEVAILTFWIYFLIGEACFAGSSLGKRACRIRSISTVTLHPPAFLSAVVRSSLKTLSIFLLFPLSPILAALLMFFGPRRQMAHDLLSQSVVVDEKFVNLQETT